MQLLDIRTTLMLLALVLPAAGQTLQLSTGDFLLANVEEANGDGLRVKRLDTGGTLQLRWDHLSPACALRIKQAFDLVGSSDEEVMVTADRVTYLIAGSPQEVIGRIVDRADNHLIVQSKGQQFRVPQREIQSRTTVQVPAQQIFTRDEYYASKLAEMQPGESADKHVLLALDLVKARDYEHAEQHLQKADELGNSLDKPRLQREMERLKRYKEAKKERDAIDAIRTARVRGTAREFERGMALIEQYDKEFAAGKLRAEFDVEQKKFTSARDKFLTLEVADLWRTSIKVVAEKKVFESGLTLQAARDYAEGKMKEDLAALVGGRLKMEPVQAAQYFAGRGQYPQAKQQDFFTYGMGSWVLGDEKIRKDTKQGAAGQKPTAGVDEAQQREIERLAKLVRQSMERREQARRNAQAGAGGEGGEETEDQWWAGASHNEKVAWLRAYYAEYGGDLTVAVAHLQDCVPCAGEGRIAEFVNNKTIQNKCHVCHGTRWIRNFRAW